MKVLDLELMGQEMHTKKIISDITSVINTTKTHEELNEVISKYCNQFSIDNYIFVASIFKLNASLKYAYNQWLSSRVISTL